MRAMRASPGPNHPMRLTMPHRRKPRPMSPTSLQCPNWLITPPAIRRLLNFMAFAGRIGTLTDIVAIWHDNPLLVATKVEPPFRPLGNDTKGP